MKTERLSLDRLTRDHSDAFTKLLSRESDRLNDSFAGTLRLIDQDPDEYFSQCDIGWENQSRFRFGLWKAQDLSGMVGLRSVDPKTGSAELFYFVSAQLQGRGYAFEATKVLVKTAVDQGLNKLWLRILPSNPRSARLALRLGFAASEILPRNYTTLDGTIHDTRVYRLNNT